ncbi:hypothetical protein FQZ97_791550 [compost metagenome]
MVATRGRRLRLGGERVGRLRRQRRLIDRSVELGQGTDGPLHVGGGHLGTPAQVLTALGDLGAGRGNAATGLAHALRQFVLCHAHQFERTRQDAQLTVEARLDRHREIVPGHALGGLHRRGKPPCHIARDAPSGQGTEQQGDETPGDHHLLRPGSRGRGVCHRSFLGAIIPGGQRHQPL